MLRLTEADLVPGQNVKQLICSICSQIFLDPVFFEGKCQCVFCRDCITKGLQAKSKCPVCEKEVTAKVLKPHLWARNALKELQVPCPNECLWTGSHESRSEHLASCPVPRIQKEGREVEQKLQVNRERQLDLRKELMALQEEQSRLEQHKQRLKEEATAKTGITFGSDQQPKAYFPENYDPMMEPGPCCNSCEMGNFMGKPFGGAPGLTPAPMGGMGPMPMSSSSTSVDMDEQGPSTAVGHPTGCPGLPPPSPKERPGRGPKGPKITAAMLAKALPGMRKQMLGESLYPAVERFLRGCPAGLPNKITGMLLEMDNSELLKMLNSEAVLQQKVDEALSVLDGTSWTNSMRGPVAAA